jgi:hypothetical protein
VPAIEDWVNVNPAFAPIVCGRPDRLPPDGVAAVDVTSATSPVGTPEVVTVQLTVWVPSAGTQEATPET